MGRERIGAAFAKAKNDGRAVFVAYLMAGDPDLEASYQALCALRDNGADILELGAPFTDPMADGPTIQRAALRSLANKTSLTDVLRLAARFRKDDPVTPLVLMGYANPVHSMGYETFADAAALAGIDGTIIVDLPPEEDGPLREAYAGSNLAVIRLATPTTDEARARKVAEGASGFIYFVAVTGVTGAGSADPAAIAGKVAMVKAVSGLPVCVGFGVKNGAQAAEMAKIADGVVVGSAFVEMAQDAHANGKHETAAQAMGRLALELRKALETVRSG
ncbi:tryptophan synthase subunit alpha [Hyphomonas sp.]|uniref:tryptophan synthase subunit alpha n=1 Tax=Hyphomonas sp. TaxID=87 RepID=UPI003918FF8F